MSHPGGSELRMIVHVGVSVTCRAGCHHLCRLGKIGGEVQTGYTCVLAPSAGKARVDSSDGDGALCPGRAMLLATGFQPVTDVPACLDKLASLHFT